MMFKLVRFFPSESSKGFMVASPSTQTKVLFIKKRLVSLADPQKVD